MAELEIFVWVREDPPASMHTFSVIASPSHSVSRWREDVYYKKRNSLKSYDADALTLWKLRTPIPSTGIDAVVDALDPDLSGVADKMLPTKTLSHYFATLPTEDSLHVIAQLGSTKRPHEENDQLGPLLKKPRTNVDISRELVARWSKPIAVLHPSLLRIHLQLPLTEEEKVPISQHTFDRLVTPFSVDNPTLTLTADKLATLFRVSNEESAESIQDSFRHIINKTPPTNGTEDAFHSTWDANISDVLQLVLSTKDFIRNSNRYTSTALKRPDYGFLVKNNCVFRGEEKGPNTSDNPRAELVEKLIYTYDPLNYILGYYAVGPIVNFVAITRPPSTTEPLFDHDLEYREHRVANLVHLIRLCGVISWMGEQLHYRNIREFVPFFRPDGLTRITIGAVVKKEFKHPNGAARVLNLVKIYQLLKDKQVPNVDALHEHSTIPPFIMVTPVGIDQIPQSGFEAFNAVVCVLQALKVMHAGPSPLYHRDIRQQNILKKRDSQDWFLIDWSDASTAPTSAVTHLRKEEHSLKVCEDDHGAEVDMWGVGYYLKDLAARNRTVNAFAVTEIAKKWMEDPTITAEAALIEIHECQHLFFAPDAPAV